MVDHAVHIAELVGPEHVGLGLDFADESEEEYDFFGYDERYYPRPPWVWPDGLEWLHHARNIVPAFGLPAASLPLRSKESLVGTSCGSSTLFGAVELHGGSRSLA